MRVAKEMSFEAAHRIPWHDGLCKNLHGHSYHLEIAFEGAIGEGGMVIDFQQIKALAGPIVADLDHAVIAAEHDRELIDAAESLGSKIHVLPYDTTAENLCQYIGDRLLDGDRGVLARHGITEIEITLRETATSYARLALAVSDRR